MHDIAMGLSQCKTSIRQSKFVLLAIARTPKHINQCANILTFSKNKVQTLSDEVKLQQNYESCILCG